MTKSVIPYLQVQIMKAGAALAGDLPGWVAVSSEESCMAALYIENGDDFTRDHDNIGPYVFDNRAGIIRAIVASSKRKMNPVAKILSCSRSATLRALRALRSRKVAVRRHPFFVRWKVTRVSFPFGECDQRKS
jgi:hypothetical protein